MKEPWTAPEVEARDCHPTTIPDRHTMSTPAISGFYAYTQTLEGVYYGPGSVKNSLIPVLEGFGTKRALIVTGRSLREKVSTLGSGKPPRV